MTHYNKSSQHGQWSVEKVELAIADRQWPVTMTPVQLIIYAPVFYVPIHVCFSSQSAPEEGDLTIRYQCDICSRYYSTKFGLQQHVLAIHQQAYRFRCGKCNAGFYSKDRCAKHVERSLKTGRCWVKRKVADGEPIHACTFPGCEMTFNRPSRLKQHISLKHEGKAHDSSQRVIADIFFLKN